MSGFGKIYESSNWGVGVCDNTIGWGSSYKSISNCSDASFSYSADSFAQDGSNPTPTITGDAGGTFTATPAGLSINSSTGLITLSTSSVNSYTVKYELSDGTFTVQSLGITAASYANVNSFNFDGIDDDMSISNINLGTTHTISYWLKTDGSDNTDMICNQYGASRIYGPAPTVLFYYANNNYAYWLNNSGGNINLNDSNWHHWCFVRNGTSIDFYADGVLQTISVNNITASDDYQFTNFMRPPSTSRYRKGELDELAVFTTALSSANVTSIYSSGTPNNISSLSPLSWWRMGEKATFSNPGGSGNWTLVDQGSGGSNATSINMAEASRTTETP